MGSKKFDIVEFHGKYCSMTFQVDRDLPPNSRERTAFLNDCKCEFEYWSDWNQKKQEEYKKGDRDRSEKDKGGDING